MTETVALYARVSSDEQRDQQTVRTQLDYARGRAKLDGWTLQEFVDDGVSGKKIPLAKRPQGAKLLEAARRGEFTRVVTYRLDRLGRRASFIHEALEDLTAAGVAYTSLTESFDTSTPSGKLFLGVLAVMAEFESDSIQQRTQDGKRRVAAYDDRWISGPAPYGYTQDDQHRLVIEPTEAANVRQMFAWLLEGWTHQRITAELNARGIPALGREHKGRSDWYRMRVSRILRSEVYAGRASYFRESKSQEVMYRNVPAIITPATYLAAQEQTAKTQRFGGSHRVYDYRLRGIVRCGHCGLNIPGQRWGKRWGYYCQRCPKAQRRFVDEAEVVTAIWSDVLEMLADPDDTLRALARSASEAGTSEERADRELMTLAQKLRELDGQEEQLLEIRLAKTITATTLDKKARAIAGERERIRMQMEAARASRAAAARAVEESESVRRLLGELAAVALTADGAHRVEIIRTVTHAVTVHTASGAPRVHVAYAFGQPSSGGTQHEKLVRR